MRLPSCTRLIPLALLLALFLPAAAAPQQRLKVYISVDMEGIAGVVSGEQLGPTGFEYQRFREFMTAEAVAAVEAAREAGATEIVVSDSHGNAQNLLIERFPADVTIVRSFPRPLGMMEGIDSTFDAAIFIGYHASTASPTGVRAHTLSSANYAGVALNSVQVPEAGINAAIAGHFGVPVVLISGDDAAVAETQRMVEGIEGAVVKRALGFHSAATMTPQAATDLIRDRVRTALSRRASVRPYHLETPVRLDLTFKNYRPSELLALLPNVERTDSHTIRFVGRDILEVARFLTFVGAYEAGLTP
jgi:D-amino peptidase